MVKAGVPLDFSKKYNTGDQKRERWLIFFISTNNFNKLLKIITIDVFRSILIFYLPQNDLKISKKSKFWLFSNFNPSRSAYLRALIRLPQ